MTGDTLSDFIDPGLGDVTDPKMGGNIPEGDDLADPGDPVEKRSYLLGLVESQGPGDHFEFNESANWVSSTTIHGTQLLVAIDAGVLAKGEGLSAEEFAAFVETAFHSSWHVFGGFAYDRYAVRIRAEDGNDEFSLSPVGITLSAADYAAPWGLEVIAHEMYHSWNGKFVQPVPDESQNLFQWETWVVEGATVYYSFRHMGFALGAEEFEIGMVNRWRSYLEYVDTPSDLSIQELTEVIGTAPPGDPSTEAPTNMLYARGALVSYMLDQELRQHGADLNDVMRQLYLDALNDQNWTREHLLEVIQLLTGEDFEPFLAEWIDSNARLPLDGTFRLD